jgi:hypothetical protein
MKEKKLDGDRRVGVSKWMDWMDLDWIVNGWIKVIHLSINNPLK